MDLDNCENWLVIAWALIFVILIGGFGPRCVADALAVERRPVLQKTVKVCAVYDFVDRKCKKWKIIKR